MDITISMWETYEKQCDAYGIKPRSQAFHEAERALRRTCAELKENKRVLVLHKDIDDTFSYVVLIEEGLARFSIIRSSDLEARLIALRGQGIFPPGF